MLGGTIGPFTPDQLDKALKKTIARFKKARTEYSQNQTEALRTKMTGYEDIIYKGFWQQTDERMPGREFLAANYDTVEPWEPGQFRAEVINLACDQGEFPRNLHRVYEATQSKTTACEPKKGMEGLFERLDLGFV